MLQAPSLVIKKNEGKYLGTLANLRLIILFSELLKFSKIYFFQIKNIVKDISEYFICWNKISKLINYLMNMCWNG